MSHATSSNPPKGSTLEPGFKLDRYELLCVLAQGGMAGVWLARLQGKHGFEKLVAVKTILPSFAADHLFQQMFLDEARIASNIEHHNVVRILDLGEQHETLYLVMELVNGDPLQRLHKECTKLEQKVPLGLALRLMSDVCAGLHAAHELRSPEGSILGVVHRDVSPQNILVTTDGVGKVIDFGIAKARDRLSADTSAGTLKGKIQYMPPEQALGQEVDRRADVWSVGAVLYYLITGTTPYSGANQVATLQKLISMQPIKALPTTVPLAVRTLVMKALELDPNKRFTSAQEMQLAIDKAMVQSRFTATAADVASFVALHLSARADARKKQIEAALKEAANRARMYPILKAPPEWDSSSGVSSVSGAAFMPAQVQDMDTLTAPPPSQRGGQRPPSNPELTPIAEHSASGTGGGTLGSAAIETPPPPKSLKRTAIFTAFGLLALVGVVGIVLSVSFGSRKTATGAPSTQSTQAAGGNVESEPPPMAIVLAPPPSAPSAVPSVAPSVTPSTLAASSAKSPVGGSWKPAGPTVAAPPPVAKAPSPPPGDKPPVQKKDPYGF